MWENIISNYEWILHIIAKFGAITLELIGISIVIIGSISALIRLARRHVKKEDGNAVIELGRILSIALEFKMGAEIINTVIIHELSELAVLGIVILLRALLAFLIHWEIKMERQDEKEEQDESDKNKE